MMDRYWLFVGCFVASTIFVLGVSFGYWRGERNDRCPQISVDGASGAPDPVKYPSVRFEFDSIDKMNNFMEVFKKDGGWDYGPNGMFLIARSVDVDMNYFSSPPCEEGKLKFACEIHAERRR